jgi:hypothetical protein
MLLMDFQLEDLSCEPVAKTKIRFENRWNRLDCKHRLQLVSANFFLVSHIFIAIKRVLDVGVRESSFDAFESLLGAERQVVNLVRIVKFDTLLSQQIDHIAKRVVGDVEVSRHSLYLEESMKTAALAIVELLKYAIEELVS